MHSNWFCKPGQGGLGTQLGSDITNYDFERCKKECAETIGCFGIDYKSITSNTHKCRMYRANTPRGPGPGPNAFQYCLLDKADRNSIDFVKLILEPYFF